MIEENDQKKTKRFEDLEQNTKMKIITINIDHRIVKAIRLLIKNGWINSRSEYIRQLIMDDIQFRILDGPNIPDLNPELDDKTAEYKILKEKVIRLNNAGKTLHDIIIEVKRHKRIVQNILCEYLDEQKQNEGQTNA